HDTALHAMLPSEKFVAYKGLVVDPARRRVLAIRYADRSNVADKVRGRLGMTGGKIRCADRPAEDFQRRVTEETGVVAELAEAFGGWSWTYARNNTLFTISAVAHVAWYRGGEIAPPKRHTETDLDAAEW